MLFLKYLPIILIAAAVTMTSCSSTLYRVVCIDTDGSSPEIKPGEKIVVFDKNYFENYDQVPNIVILLNKGTLEQNLTQFDLTAKEKVFVRVVNLMKKGEFQSANSLLQSLNDDDFDCQAGLLKIDCKREMKIGTVTTDDYQTIYDCSQDSLVKEMVKQRFRFYKYGF